jgi:hypothetical protein
MKASLRMPSLVPKLGLGAVVLVPHFGAPDFYWHIKTGEYLLSSWPLPGSEVFTCTHSGDPCKSTYDLQ